MIDAQTALTSYDANQEMLKNSREKARKAHLDKEKEHFLEVINRDAKSYTNTITNVNSGSSKEVISALLL